MRNKFLNTGEIGYHPIRKIMVCISGLRYAIRYDFSVTYKIKVQKIYQRRRPASAFCCGL